MNDLILHLVLNMTVRCGNPASQTTYDNIPDVELKFNTYLLILKKTFNMYVESQRQTLL